MHLSPLIRAVAAATLCSALAAPALADAQSDRLQALEKRLEDSVKLIEKLSARVSELELERGAKAMPVAAAPEPLAHEQAQAITALQDNLAQISEGMSRSGVDAGLPLHGFADVGAGWSSGDDPIKLRGFNGGTFDLYLTPQFSTRAKGLVEIALEYGEDGGFEVDMERLQLGYTVNDSLTAWVGRFHTPFGLFNTSFHHGANLQTAIYRPRFIDFEDKGGIVPAHSVGLWASGKTAAAGGKLTYDAYLANGPRIAERTLDFNAFSDNNSNKMLGINLGYQASGSLTGLTLGVHAFDSDVAVYDTRSNIVSSTQLRMMGGYVGYDEGDWEVIGEYYHFANVDGESRSRRASNAGFLQVGKTWGMYTPFVRLEKVSLNPADNYFRSQASGRSYERYSLGMRYALDPKASFKFELGDTRETAADLVDENGTDAPIPGRRYRRAAFQYSVAF